MCVKKSGPAVPETAASSETRGQAATGEQVHYKRATHP